MANEIHAMSPVSGTHYAVLLNRAGQAWNGSAFESVVDANWATYAIALTRRETTRLLLGDMPAVVAGEYDVSVFSRAGATPSVGDAVVGMTTIGWDGTATRLSQDVGVSTSTQQAMANALLDLGNGVETGVTLRNMLRYIGAAVMGLLSGAEGTTITLQAVGNPGTTRAIVLVDSNNNRTSITLS